MLSKFWGRPIYLGATVLLPRVYDRETMSYPALYDQGHFASGAPLRFDPEFKPTERQPYNIAMDWMKPDFPKMVVVTFQHPTPYFDDSYAVNSVNVGPYGDAIMQELIPEVEKRFRVLKEPYARVLSGGSTGGWESLALQIFHPDFFGGTLLPLRRRQAALLGRAGQSGRAHEGDGAAHPRPQAGWGHRALVAPLT